jgi:predicted Fe-Mo cluster-binding NifX family protein
VNIVCIPVSDDQGLRARVVAGLDAAPVLLFVETSSLTFRAVPNQAQRRRDRGCDPCEALDDTPVDALLVESIEPAALARVTRRGVRVLSGARGTASHALSDYVAGRLRRLLPAPNGDGPEQAR